MSFTADTDGGATHTNGDGPHGSASRPSSRVLEQPEREYLDARAVPPGIRDNLAQYYTVTDPAELVELGFSKKIANLAVPALVMAGQCLDGDCFIQIKPRTPVEFADRNGKMKKAKALFPAGGGGRMHVAKGTQKHADDARILMLLGESIVKADAASEWADQKVFSLGFGGSSGYKAPNSKGGRTVLEDLRSIEIAWTGRDGETGEDFVRDVWCCFDSNVASNPQVANAAQNLGAFVRGKGANYHIIGLPAGPDGKSIGIDDWRVMNPGATFADLKKLEITEQLDLGAINYKACKAKIDELFAIDTRSHEIIDLTTGSTLSPYTFDKVGASIYKYIDSNGKQRSAAERWRGDPDRNSRNGRVWLPGAPNPTVNNEYNEFSPLPSPSVEIPRDLVLANLGSWYFPLRDHVFQSEVERRYVEEFFARKYQNPAFKIPVGIIVWGDQGSGKSLFFEALGRVLFGNYFSAPDKQQLESNFNASWAKKKLIISCEEIDEEDKRSSRSTWKNRISEATVSLNAKFKNEESVTAYHQFVFTANHEDSFLIDTAGGGDRRFFVSHVTGRLDDAHKGLGPHIWSLLHPETSGTMDRQRLLREIQVAYDCLRIYFRDFNEFGLLRPGEDAMMTPAKRHMLCMQRSDLVRDAHELIEEAHERQRVWDEIRRETGLLPEPSWHNLLIVEDTISWADRRRSTQWRRALEGAGARPLLDPAKLDDGAPRQVRIDKTTFRPYALINYDYWQNASTEALKTALKGNGSVQKAAIRAAGIKY
jgi:hypothetical protein